MTDKLLIEALERIADMRTAGGDFIEMHRHELRGIAKTALAAHRSQQDAAQEPVGYMSPQQLTLIVDRDDESGVYIPLRRTPKGNFTLALYTASAAPSESEALPEHETPEMHQAIMKVLYEGGITRGNTDRLWQAYRAALSASGQKGEPT